MTENVFWWFTQFSVNFLDFVMLYVVMHALLKQRLTFKIKHLALAILYTMIVAPIGYFDNYGLRVAGILFFILVVKLIAKRGLSDIVLIYIIFMTMTLLIQPIVLLPLWIFGLNQSVTFLVGQTLTTMVLILICTKFKLNQWFYALQINAVLKLMFCVVFFLLLIVVFILNFEYHITYFIFFTTTIFLTGITLFPIITKLYHHSIGMISVHDLQNSLLSMGIAMENTDNIEDVRKMIRKHSKKFGMDLSQLDKKKFEDELNHMQLMAEQVNTFIEVKKESRNKSTEIIADIMYHKDYAAVDFELMLTWLGTLLDNSLDASINKPIYVNITVSTNRLLLKVANEYTGNEGKDIEVIFEKGYSTKENGMGIGLHHLYQEATEKGAEVVVDEYYNEEHHCHYLEIKIYFKKGLYNINCV